MPYPPRPFGPLPLFKGESLFGVASVWQNARCALPLRKGEMEGDQHIATNTALRSGQYPACVFAPERTNWFHDQSCTHPHLYSSFRS